MESGRRLCRAMGLFQMDVEEVDAEGMTPLMRAAASGMGARAVRALMAAGANVNAADGFGQTPIYLAAQYGHAEVVAELGRQGADANAAAFPDEEAAANLTPMWIAAQARRRDLDPAERLHGEIRGSCRSMQMFVRVKVHRKAPTERPPPVMG